MIWLDNNIDDNGGSDCHTTITKLRQVVNTIPILTQVNQCIDFITDIKLGKFILIPSCLFGESITPIIHGKFKVQSIYVFCITKSEHEQWAKQWTKNKRCFYRRYTHL
jgi:hypothetical protein